MRRARRRCLKGCNLDGCSEFEVVYPQRYQERYGYWRPVTRASIDKFLKCGDLVHWPPHIHAIVPEGVFTQSGHASTGLCTGFVHIPDVLKDRAVEFWQEQRGMQEKREVQGTINAWF